MALLTKLPSSSSSITHFKIPQKNPTFNSSRFIHFTKTTCKKISPFTEKDSVRRYQRDKWVFNNQLNNETPSEKDSNFSTRDYEIAIQLPELKKLLDVLREKREKDGDEREKDGFGNVFLVGTGPGDPDLLTLKALKVIQKADLVLYDRLVSNDVLDLVSPNARLLYVGKTAGYHSRTQVCYFFNLLNNFVIIIIIIVSFGLNLKTLKKL